MDLNNYVTVKEFNNMCLKERVEIVNQMLKKYDLQVIDRHLGIDIDFLFWLFNYNKQGNKYIKKN